MQVFWVGKTGRADRRAGKAGRAGRAGRFAAMAGLMACFLSSPALPGSHAQPAFALGQVPFEQAVAELASPEPENRLRAATLLKAAAYPEAAIPLAKAVLDAEDAIQLEAIAAELNIFLASKIVPKKKVGLIVEVRTKIAAEAAFSAGPLALGATPVPLDVLTALRTAARDNNPRVALEALYAFGALASEPTGAVRRELRQASGPELTAMVGASDETLRAAAVRVIGRVYAAHASDDDVETSVGDAIITALNDQNRLIKRAAMEALGAMRYGRGVEALTKLFEYYKQGELAEAAFDALAQIAHPASIPLFASQLGAKSTAMKTMALEGLARAGDPSQMGAIEAALKGQHDQSVIFAGAFASAMLEKGSIDPITDALPRPKQRELSKQYLVDLARGRAGLLSRYAQDPDPGVRADIADVLGFSGDTAAQPIVESLIKDQDKQVALAAERAALRLRGSALHGDR
jgi:HEAT repeat protein